MAKSKETTTVKIQLKKLNRYRVMGGKTYERGVVYEVTSEEADYLLGTGQFEITRDKPKKTPKRFPSNNNQVESSTDDEDEDFEEDESDDDEEDEKDSEPKQKEKKSKKIKEGKKVKVSKKKSVKV